MAGFKEYILEFRLADGTMHSIPFRVPLGEDGEDGGYYTPVAREVSDRDVEIKFVPSKPGMPVIAPFIIKGGEPGKDGTVSFDELTEEQREYLRGDPFTYEDFTDEQLAALKGKPGDDYVLTPADKAEIAEMAAELVEIPDSGGNVDFKTDETLILENGILSVNTTNDMERDNTLPITSAGVFATVGNIEALLKTI